MGCVSSQVKKNSVGASLGASRGVDKLSETCKIRAIEQGPFYTLQNVESSQALNHGFLSVASDSVTGTAWISQFDDPWSWPSHWTFLDTLRKPVTLRSGEAVHGPFYIQNRQTGLYLNVAESSSSDGASIWPYQFEAHGSSQWEIVLNFDTGGYNLVNVQSKKFVKVKGNSRENGTQIIQYGGNSSNRSSQWKILDVLTNRNMSTDVEVASEVSRGLW